MTKDNRQGDPQKTQTNRNIGITLNESQKTSKDSSSFGKSRKGTAGDSTNSTGPRKK